jgi:CMP-N-acetylneuraminic acid synthetase
MSRTLCIIPARGGSKRIPRKNLLPLAGKPLLAYSVDAATHAGVFDEVIVSSDDEEILALADSLGVVPDRRPERLSGDKTRFVEVIEEYLLRPGMRDRYGNVASMLPTCPFRIVDDILGSYQLFRQQVEDVFVIAVTEYDFPPQLAMDMAEDGIRLSMRDSDTYGRTTRSQSLGKAYHPNGAIYLASVEGFLREKTFFSQPLIGYVMPPERSFDIDYPYQFQIAEFMMKGILQDK